MGGGKGGGGSAPAPDPNIGRAALKQAELGEEWLSFAREQFDIANVRQEGIDDLTKRVTEQQLSTQDRANQWSSDDRERWEQTFRPIEDKFLEDATGWDSKERQEQIASEARGDVLSSADMQRQQRERELASMGADPRSGRFQGQSRADALATGVTAAGAQNNARNMVRSQGMAMRADAANMGRGLPSQAASAASLGLGAGSSALGGAHGAHSSFLGNTSIMGQGFGSAMQGYGNQANILNTQHQSQLNAWSANQQAQAQGAAGLWGGLGMLGGALITSDENSKKNKTPVSGALDAINGMPVEAWDYKEGVADEGRHIGPYAQDFKRETGLGDGKTISVVDAIGLAIKGIQELDDKLDAVAQGKKRPKAAIDHNTQELLP